MCACARVSAVECGDGVVMDETQDEGRRSVDEVAAIIISELRAMAGAHRKHQCRKGLLLKQFSGRLTASNLLLKSSDGHLGFC